MSASLVPSYTGASSYLLMTKYNNYAGAGTGDGKNRIAILDPNVTEHDPVLPATLVMKEVLTILGVTPDNNGFPGAVREWSINTAAVDPTTKSEIANSEDGKLYRWDLTTNTLSQSIRLTNGIGEAYTPHSDRQRRHCVRNQRRDTKRGRPVGMVARAPRPRKP